MSDLLGLLILLGTNGDHPSDGNPWHRRPADERQATLRTPTAPLVAGSHLDSNRLRRHQAPRHRGAPIRGGHPRSPHRRRASSRSGPIDLVAGALGTVISILHVIEGNDCQGPLGLTGIVLLLMFCGTTALCMVTTALSSRRLTVGQGFVAICAAIELALFAVSPGGILPAGIGDLAINVVIALTLAILIGARPHLGLATMGACRIVAQTSLALSSASCDRSAPIALAGALVFAATRLLLSSRRNRQLVGVR